MSFRRIVAMNAILLAITIGIIVSINQIPIVIDADVIVPLNNGTEKAQIWGDVKKRIKALLQNSSSVNLAFSHRRKPLKVNFVSDRSQFVSNEIIQISLHKEGMITFDGESIDPAQCKERINLNLDAADALNNPPLLIFDAGHSCSNFEVYNVMNSVLPLNRPIELLLPD